MARGAPLDQVARKGEGRAGKADQRRLSVQLGAHQADCLQDEGKVGHWLDEPQPVHIGRRPDGVVDDWAFSRGELKVGAHRLQWQ
jgi:hypothetical protein